MTQYSICQTDRHQ